VSAHSGLIILACLAAWTILGAICGWFTGQYEVTRHGITRRWYGIRAWIVLRAAADEDEPDHYQVLGWDQEDTCVPWVRVMNVDNEDAESFWAPVTDFAPCMVRRLRPHLARYGPVLMPQLHVWLPLRQPAGYLGDGVRR
jgi:hypothetical protein